MVVCKYFLNNSCKFGDRCRFEHPRSNSGFTNSATSWHQGGKQQPSAGKGGFGGSFASPNRFAVLGNDAGNRGRGPGPNASGQPGGFGDGGNAEPPPGEILDSIKRDMEEWSASGMWPYSSYRPTRADGDIPGFQDLSQEELRTEAYSAEKENRFDAYKSALSASSSALQKKREMLAKPSQELKNSVISIYRGQMKAESLGGRSIFGGQEMLTLEIFIKSGSKLFQNSAASGGLSSPPTGLFSTPAAPSGTRTGGFGPATFGSSFGAQSTATPSSPPQGLFSNPSGPSSTGFSSATPSFGGSSGVFNKPAQPQTAAVPIGLFGKPAETQTAAAPIGLFGKPAEPQTTAAPIGLFGKPAESQTAAAPIGLFGKPAEPQTAGLFGKPVQSAAPTGLFGKPAAAVQGSGLFGKPTQATGLFGKPIQLEQGGQNVEAKWYTPLGDLTAEEKEQFEAASFTLGNIPTRPPPLELVSAAA